jgi:hypothetical protein
MALAKRLTITVAAVVSVLLVFEAGKASATRLCAEQGVNRACPKPASIYPAGTNLEIVQVKNSVFSIGLTEDTCKSSLLGGKTETAGGGAKTLVIAAIEKGGWAECTCPTTQLAEMKALFGGSGNRDGDMVLAEIEVEINCAGVRCVYVGTPEMPVLGGMPAMLEVAVTLKKLVGGIFCKEPATWTAQYEFLAPWPLYITET